MVSFDINTTLQADQGDPMYHCDGKALKKPDLSGPQYLSVSVGSVRCYVSAVSSWMLDDFLLCNTIPWVSQIGRLQKT